MSSAPSPLWPATLHHFLLESPDAGRLADFHAAALQMQRREARGDSFVLGGPGRLMVVAPGSEARARHIAYAVAEPARLDDLRAQLVESGINAQEADSPLLRERAFAVEAPSGVRLVFGVPHDSYDASGPVGLPGRLQHVVFRSPEPESLLDFLIERIGFVLSDRVEDEDRSLNAGFVRSDPEHHSFAAFRAGRTAFDHFALETTGWNDLRDWGDHFSALHIPIWWGPGRHGPGNNLFLMIRDPDGHRIEISAEMERMEADIPHRIWPMEERTLNLWGSAWMRS